MLAPARSRYRSTRGRSLTFTQKGPLCTILMPLQKDWGQAVLDRSGEGMGVSVVGLALGVSRGWGLRGIGPTRA
ncbi:MAG: hypothetical protein RIS24_1618, partial [Verrucomicrobiota bacterium]